MALTHAAKSKAQFNEGHEAAARFQAAVKHLAAVSPNAAPRPQPHPRAKGKKKR